MNFKVNNINFAAKYTTYGKKNAYDTSKVYDEAIQRLEYQRKIAVQAQEYMEDPLIQSYIDQLPDDTFVRFHSGIIDREGARKDDVLSYSPFLSFETKSINEQINIKKQYGASGDTLELSLNSMDNLDKKPIINWFENLAEFYLAQK